MWCWTSGYGWPPDLYHWWFYSQVLPEATNKINPWWNCYIPLQILPLLVVGDYYLFLLAIIYYSYFLLILYLAFGQDKAIVLPCQKWKIEVTHKKLAFLTTTSYSYHTFDGCVKVNTRIPDTTSSFQVFMHHLSCCMHETCMCHLSCYFTMSRFNHNQAPHSCYITLLPQ